MKKKILCGLLAIMLCLTLTGCGDKKENEKYIIERVENIEDNKKLLELIYHDPDIIYFDIPEAEVESVDIYYKIDLSKYENRINKIYENEDNLADLVKIIKEKLNITIDNRWYYIINKYNEEEETGRITFLYFIDNVIGTNRAIHFKINHGIANKLSYSYLDRQIDEESILYKYNYFINHYKQEKKIIDKFKDYYTIDGDVTYYSYYYGNNKLFYSYNILYKELPLGTIDNDWGTEMYIEPKLMEDILNTKKIIIRDSNSHEIINSIFAKDTIREVAEVLSRTLPMGNSEELVDVTNSNWILELYDENEVLIDTLYVWNDGKLGYNNSREEYLKDQYKDKLIKIITEAN